MSTEPRSGPEQDAVPCAGERLHVVVDDLALPGVLRDDVDDRLTTRSHVSGAYVGVEVADALVR